MTGSGLSGVAAGLFMIGLVALLVRNAGGVAQIVNAVTGGYANVLKTAGGLPAR